MSRVVTLFSVSGATDVAESGVSDGTGDAAVIILRSPRSSADLVATVRRALESS
jgi:hypothetical protein